MAVIHCFHLVANTRSTELSQDDDEDKITRAEENYQNVCVVSRRFYQETLHLEPRDVNHLLRQGKDDALCSLLFGERIVGPWL